MIQSRVVKSFVAVSLLTSNFALAGNGTETKVAEKQGTLTTQDGCEIKLNYAIVEPGKSLATRIETNSPLAELIANNPRKITIEKYSPVNSKNRDAQDTAAKALAVNIAEMLLSAENIGSEDALIRTQDILSNTLGKLPDGVLNTIETILEADLGALNDPRKQPQYKKNTNNALAELTKVVTEYRKSGLDVNTLANQANKLSGLPFVGKFFTSVGDLLRERFQSVKSAIAAINDTLEQSLGHMRMRHEQMKQARLELRSLERYLEISLIVAEDVERMAQEYKDSTSMDENAKSLFDKHILLPLAQRKQMILRERAAVITAYNLFRQLMDGNMNLIVVIGNIRETAKLELSVFGAGKIIANEQRVTMNMAQNTLEALDELRKSTVEQIKQQGIEIRKFPEVVMNSTEKMIGAIDQLLIELEVAQENDSVMIAKLGASSHVFKKKLDEAAVKGGHVDLAVISDGLNQDPGYKSVLQKALADESVKQKLLTDISAR